MRRAPVVAGQRCIEAKGRKLWLRWSEPPLLGVHRGPLALSQGSTVSSHRQKALRALAQPLHAGPGPTAPAVGTMAAPSPCRPRQSLTLLRSPRAPLLLRCHCRGRQVCLLTCPRGLLPVSPSLPPPPLQNRTTLPPAPGPPVSFDRPRLPQRGLRSLTRRAAAEGCLFP